LKRRHRAAAGGAKELGTLLGCLEKGMLARRKQWFGGICRRVADCLLTRGARESAGVWGRRSLLPVASRRFEGSFRRGEMVVCVGPDGREVGAGGWLIYSARDAARHSWGKQRTDCGGEGFSGYLGRGRRWCIRGNLVAGLIRHAGVVVASRVRDLIPRSKWIPAFARYER